MTILQNFPLVTQRTTVTGDGKPSENANQDCVAASIDAACRYLLNQPENSVFNPDTFKDKAYGDAWIGGTAAKAYVPFCASLGVHLYPFNGIPGQLVQKIHEELRALHPCIVTVPDIYVPNSYGWTHVLCAFGEQSGQITMLDPWPGKPTTKSDAEWIDLLLDNQIWITERMDEVLPPITITNPTVAAYFTQTSPTSWHCNRTGKVVQAGMLSYYQSCGSSELHGLADLGLPVSNEIPLDGKGNVRQHFERGVLFYDPQHVYDKPPGSGSVYHAHLYGGPGQDPAIAELQAQIAQLKAQPAPDTAALAALQAQLDSEKAKAQQTKTALQAVVAGL